MIVLLSPSKTLDYDTLAVTKLHSQPDMLNDSLLLIKTLKKYSPAKIATLMDLSDKLAHLNYDRYQTFSAPFTPDNARQALLAFKGDVYAPMEVASYTKKQFEFAQAHLRILSGLYGLLKPLDLMQPYRLEMGTSLPNPRGKDLYKFWGNRITKAINNTIKDHKIKTVINLASVEYFHSVKPELLDGKLLTIAFKEKEKQKSGLKVIGLFAKKARGMMANFIIKNGIDDSAELKAFTQDGYSYQRTLSNEQEWVFTR